jgi:hypothetical protein
MSETPGFENAAGGTAPSTDPYLVPAQPPAPPAPPTGPTSDYGIPPQYAPAPHGLSLTGAETFWYILQCIDFGAGYLAKVPMKKALSEAGLVQMTDAEKMWYTVLCILFGAGYFAKVPAKKALNEAGLAQRTGAEQFWYVLQCICFGWGYFAKIPHKKALTEVPALPAAR